jgi:hypothetical protein
MTGYPNAHEIAEYLGTRNWVVARRTRRIISMFGDDVTTLSQRQFSAMREAIVARRIAANLIPFPSSAVGE